ncbi:MAG TPA: hypothetical protein VD768_00915, partial [Sphingomicrobium sp.]|nr:hypothetical protein [Sphingomicrobium sp.]
MLAEQQEARPFILIEAGASALLGLAIACAVLLILQSAHGAAAAGLFGAVASFLALDRAAGATRFSVANFEVAALEPPAELELTLDQRIVGVDELSLDDPLPMPSA